MREIQNSEFAVKFKCFSISSPSGFFSSRKTAYIIDMISLAHIRNPPLILFEEMNAYKTARIAFANSSVLNILSIGTWPKIVFAIIQAIMVFVVESCVRALHDVLMHKHMFPIDSA